MGTKTFHQKMAAKIESRAIYLSSSGPTPWQTEFQVGDNVTGSVTTSLEVKGWRDEIKHHRSATSKMDAVQYRIHGHGDGFFGATVRQAPSPPFGEIFYRAEIRGHFGAISAPGEGGVPACLAIANNQALMNLNRSILRARQSIPGLVALGELGETLRMIRNPAKSLWEGIFGYMDTAKKRASKRGLSRKVKRRVIEDTWLEYSFGWVPLISDIKGAAEGLAKRSAYMAEVQRVSGYGSSQNTTHYGNYSNVVISHLKLERKNITNITSANVRYHGVVSNDPGDWLFGDATFGFTPSDVLPAVWELIPYSFLVDYFTNIGNVIQAYTLDTSGVRWLEKGTRTSSYNYVAELNLILSGLPFPRELYSYIDVIKNLPGGSNGYEIIRKSRDKFEQSTVPSLEFSIPGLGLKWLNLTALASTHRHAISSVFGR